AGDARHARRAHPHRERRPRRRRGLLGGIGEELLERHRGRGRRLDLDDGGAARRAVDLRITHTSATFLGSWILGARNAMIGLLMVTPSELMVTSLPPH